MAEIGTQGCFVYVLFNDKSFDSEICIDYTF